MEMNANNLFNDRDDNGDLLARYRMLWLDYGTRLKEYNPPLPPADMLREATGIGLMRRSPSRSRTGAPPGPRAGRPGPGQGDGRRGHDDLTGRCRDVPGPVLLHARRPGSRSCGSAPAVADAPAPGQAAAPPRRRRRGARRAVPGRAGDAGPVLAGPRPREGNLRRQGPGRVDPGVERDGGDPGRGRAPPDGAAAVRRRAGVLHRRGAAGRVPAHQELRRRDRLRRRRRAGRGRLRHGEGPDPELADTESFVQDTERIVLQGPPAVRDRSNLLRGPRRQTPRSRSRRRGSSRSW